MDQHKIVSREAWVQARVALLEREKAFTRARDALSMERRCLPWVEITKPYTFNTNEGERRWRICSAITANWWFTTSCMVPTGRPAARAVPSGRIISTETSPILRPVMLHWLQYHAHRLRRSMHFAGGWTGALIGYRPAAAISTMILTCHSRRKCGKRVKSATITKPVISPLTMHPASAFFARARTQQSTTPIRPMDGDSTCSMPAITIWILFQKAVTKMETSPCHG